MKKLITILFSGLLWIALFFGLTACNGRKPNPESVPYTITYNLGECRDNDEAVITADTQTVYYNKAITLYTPTCGDYKFVGWRLEGDNKLFDATVYPFDGDVTLVAVWNAPRYINYNLGVCEGNDEAEIAETRQLVYKGESFTLQTPTCGLYKFVGWTLEDELFNETEYAFDNDITLVAVWNAPHYITYNLGLCEGNDEAEIAETTQLVYKDEPFTLQRATCGLYKFMGWTLPNESRLFAFNTYPFDSDITLVAKWDVPYTVTLHLGICEDNPNAEVEEKSFTIYYGNVISIANPKCELYLFMGWKVQSTGEMLETTTYIWQEDIILEAVWKTPLKITYHLGELEGRDDLDAYKPPVQTVYYEETFYIRSPKVEGYQFAYWVVQGSEEVLESGKYPYETDITAVAVWADAYKITYQVGDVEDPTQVVIDSTTQDVYYGYAFELIKDPTCPGYTFLGWKIEGEDAFFTDTTYNFEKDIVLVGYWEKREYTGNH